MAEDAEVKVLLAASGAAAILQSGYSSA